MSTPASRPLRADAQKNHDRLLQAAARAFARDGTQASLKAIAEDAGVGIATLYRRFPTREQLVEETYRREVARVNMSVEKLLATVPPVQALRDWMLRFIDLLAAKYGMADTLRVALAGKDGVRLQIRESLTESLRRLLEAGIANETLRADIDAADILLGLGGIALIAGSPQQHAEARRLVALLVDGLRFSADRS